MRPSRKDLFVASVLEKFMLVFAFGWLIAASAVFPGLAATGNPGALALFCGPPVAMAVALRRPIMRRNGTLRESRGRAQQVPVCAECGLPLDDDQPHFAGAVHAVCPERV